MLAANSPSNDMFVARICRASRPISSWNAVETTSSGLVMLSRRGLPATEERHTAADQPTLYTLRTKSETSVITLKIYNEMAESVLGVSFGRGRPNHGSKQHLHTCRKPLKAASRSAAVVNKREPNSL